MDGVFGTGLDGVVGSHNVVFQRAREEGRGTGGGGGRTKTHLARVKHTLNSCCKRPHLQGIASPFTLNVIYFWPIFGGLKRRSFALQISILTITQYGKETGKN